MTKKIVLLVLVGFGWVTACGDSNETSQSFTDTFRTTDTVASSIFGQTGNPVAGDFRMKVVADGVSSGFVKLNDNDLLRPNDFKNKSFETTFPVALYEGNSLEIEVRGSPGDQLCVRVFELNVDRSERGIYERCVDREAGPPNHVDVVIDITPTPTPTP